MNSSQRLKAMVDNKPIDRVAVSGWFHMPLIDHNIEDFVRGTIAYTDYCGWDLIKIMPNGNFMPEAYNADLIPSKDPLQWCGHFNRYPLQTADDVANIQVLDGKSGSFLREVTAAKRIVEHYDGAIPALQTIFSPLTSIQEMMSSLDPTGVKSMMRENPGKLHKGLESITQTIKNYLDELIEVAHIDGVFFANQFSMRSIITDAEFDEFVKPYDLEVLNHIKNRTWFNMVHIHGDANLRIQQFMDYPVQSYNWENVPHNGTSIKEMRSLTDKILIGGVDQEHDFFNSDNNRSAIKDCLRRRLETALEECGDKKFIFAPGCSMPLDLDKYVYAIMHEVVEEFG